MKGYSGFILRTNGKVFCKDTNKDPQALLHQAHKQMKYRGKLLDSPMKLIFDVPKVTLKTGTGFCMDFVYGYNIIDVLETCDISTIDTIIDRVFSLIDWEFSISKKRLLNVEAFKNKLSVDCPMGFRKHIMNKLHEKYRFVSIGMCHGDYSFANMIFGDKIYLIDFLSPFIRSPYQDIAKLLQSVNLKWSYLMLEKPVDDVKVSIGYKYLKKEIYKKIDAYDKDLVHIFYFMCLCRLFAYTTEKTMYNLIYNECEKEIKNDR